MKKEVCVTPAGEGLGSSAGRALSHVARKRRGTPHTGNAAFCRKDYDDGSKGQNRWLYNHANHCAGTNLRLEMCGLGSPDRVWIPLLTEVLKGKALITLPILKRPILSS